MKRRLRPIAALVALGLMTAVAIALALPVFVRPEVIRQRPAPFQITGFTRQGEWYWCYVFDLGFGSTQIVWTPMHESRFEGQLPVCSTLDGLPRWSARCPWTPERPFGRFEIEYVEDARGWPLPALYSWRKTHAGGAMIRRAGKPEFVYVRNPVEVSGWVALPPAITSRIRGSDGVSLWPIWSGLLIDAAFWSTGWAALAMALVLLRRGIRRWRGRCPRCAYDLQGAPGAGCPECGWHKPLLGRN